MQIWQRHALDLQRSSLQLYREILGKPRTTQAIVDTATICCLRVHHLMSVVCCHVCWVFHAEVRCRRFPRHCQSDVTGCTPAADYGLRMIQDW